ncbi:MAG: hypothetical protein IPO06_19300 [Leptospiraceae bacterium]|nr:hypothetical protein [Leptospiraceae bacterium]MBK7056226.1 hypothetical protein [Leptospiraceae bacterium]MBK9501478.1 hypothetical protein [Leptospiraceae bacterium]MBP9888260.1 hypothetical protein [Leptospiraceae bacterium]
MVRQASLEAAAHQPTPAGIHSGRRARRSVGQRKANPAQDKTTCNE